MEAPDLRGGAALTLAALAAEGESRITGLLHIDRGYEALEQDLSALGQTSGGRPFACYETHESFYQSLTI